MSLSRGVQKVKISSFPFPLFKPLAMFDYEIMSLLCICARIILCSLAFTPPHFRSHSMMQLQIYYLLKRYNTRTRKEIKRMAEKDEEQILIEFPCWNERKYDFAWFLSSVITIIFFFALRIRICRFLCYFIFLSTISTSLMNRMEYDVMREKNEGYGKFVWGY